MLTIESLFEKYINLRLRGQDIDAVYSKMQDEVINNLNREERNTLATRCDGWEKDRTQPDLSYIQKEAQKRTQLSNITLKITFCPACDAPNAEGFTRCQVCDEPLAVAHVQKKGTTGIVGQKGAKFERENKLILKVVASNDRLVLQPQISPTGITLGRKTARASCDVDLNPFGGGDYGVSRIHAIIRFERALNRLIIVDNGSTNGTFLNGVRIAPNMDSVISDGDELKLARMVFRVKFK